MKRTLPLEIEEQVKALFKSATAIRGENMTMVLRKCIIAYTKDPEKFMKFLNKTRK